jgi:hypothetical protein
MPKLSLPLTDRIVGVVAMSYLVIIPVCVYAGYEMLQNIREDLAELRERQGLDQTRYTTSDLR